MSLSKRWMLAGSALLAILLSVSPRAQAGQIHQRFAELLARTPAHGTISGLVMLAEQPDVPAMERQLSVMGWSSRWRRHQFVVQSAQALAARTQADLLTTLEAWKAEGVVRSYEFMTRHQSATRRLTRSSPIHDFATARTAASARSTSSGVFIRPAASRA